MIEVNEKIDGLMRTQKALESSVRDIKKQLKPLLTELKKTCNENNLRTFDYGSWKVKFTPDRKYWFLLKSLDEIAEEHPSYVEERIGYERITFTSK
jgi:hypothetical protein